MSHQSNEESPSNHQPDGPARRGFLIKISIALSALIGAVIAPPVAAALADPLLDQAPPVWRDVGGIDDFVTDNTVLVSFQNSTTVAWAGKTGKTGAWLRRNGESEFEAFTLNCAHLGCPVRWEQEAELFLCPCHGGVYYKDGTVASGPPPRPLAKYPVKVEAGRVLVRAEPVPVTTLTELQA